MLEVEIQKLTAAIEALTKAIESDAEKRPKAVESVKETPTETPTITDKPRQKKAKAEAALEPTPAPVPEPPSSKSYDQNAVRELAMQIVRDDSTARPRIMEILGQYGAKTTNQLKPEDCHEVHGKLLALAFDIAKNGESV